MKRQRIVKEARRFLGIPYVEGAAPQATGTPHGLDCSGLVRTVCLRLFNDDSRLAPGHRWPSARLMFEKLLPVVRPRPGDLAFYSKPTQDGELWHVMFVSESGGVLGACSEKKCVFEYQFTQYSRGWSFQGFREVPLEQEDVTVSSSLSSTRQTKYIRFNPLPLGGLSTDYARNEFEEGTSCFDLREEWNRNAGVGWHPEVRSQVNKVTMKPRIGLYSRKTQLLNEEEKTVWLVVGEEDGTDCDGEPSLAPGSAFILSKLTWDETESLFLPTSCGCMEEGGRK